MYRSVANEIKKKREDYEKSLNEVLTSLKKIENIVKSVSKLWAVDLGKSVLILADIVMKVVRITALFDDGADVAANAFRAANVAGKGIAIAGAVINIVLLPIDAIMFGICVKKLTDGEKAALAESIRAWLNQDLPNDEEIDAVVTRLSSIVSDLVLGLRTISGEEEHIIFIESQGDQLKGVLDEINNLIKPIE